MRPLSLSAIPPIKWSLPPLPFVIGRGRGGDGRHDSLAGSSPGKHQFYWPRASEAGVFDPIIAPAQWLESAAIGVAHVRPAHLRLENRKREGHPDPVIAGAPGSGPGGHGAGFAFRWRTESAGRSSRVDGRSVRRRSFAVSVATERNADVEHSGAGAGLDCAAATQCLASSPTLV